MISFPLMIQEYYHKVILQNSYLCNYLYLCLNSSLLSSLRTS
jgi:hypothetical protein